jgi:glutamate-1-semialdehyde 2,1-aminomutase
MPHTSLNINQKIPSINELTPRLESQKIFETAQKLLPGGVNSPVRSFRGYLPYPLVVRSSLGPRLYDVDSRSYLDLINSWGALIHGHNHPYVREAIIDQVKMGWGYGALCEKEAEYSALVLKVTGHEKMRFVCSGTEATMTAVRIARSITGRSRVLKFSGHYHGHSDSFLIQAGSGVLEQASQEQKKVASCSSSAGVPSELVSCTSVIPFNDLEALGRYFKEFAQETAAVILEPVAGNMGTVPAEQNYIEALRHLTKEKGILLIFDEVMTGLRIGLRGAREYFGIEADLVCYGKVIGCGLPVAAVAGSAVFMDQLAPVGKTYQAGTLAGNPIAMAAGQAGLELLLEEGFYERLEEKANFLETPILQVIETKGYPVSWVRAGSMMNLFFKPQPPKNMEEMVGADTSAYTAMFRFLFERGVLLPPSSFETWFLSDAYKREDLEEVSLGIIEFLRAYYG